MSTERIQAALRDATDTKDVVIAAGVLSSVGEIFDRSFGDVPAVVVADENTYEVAGDEVHRQLKAAGRKVLDPYVFPGGRHCAPSTATSPHWPDGYGPTTPSRSRSRRGRSTTSSSAPPTSATGRTSRWRPLPRSTATPRSVLRSPRMASSRP